MMYLLAQRHRSAFVELARTPVLLAFDFDGTLAPIVADRERAKTRPTTRRLLARVAMMAPCAVISGRAVPDLRRRLLGVPVRYLVGNHGASAHGSLKGRGAIEHVIDALGAEFTAMNGVEIEDAGLSIAVHYRHAPRAGAAKRAIESAVLRFASGMRIVPGKMVVNLVPAELPHKGDALQRLMRTERLASALYVGDDRTDEDAFRLGAASGVIGVRVGRTRDSAAPWFLRNQGEIDDLLGLLAFARTGGRRSPR